MTRRYFEKDGKKYIEVKSEFTKTRVFEIVNKFPQGYILWNVPFDYPDNGYIALARPSNIPYNVKTDDLKCMYVGEEMHEKIYNYSQRHNEDISCLNYDEIINYLSK